MDITDEYDTGMLAIRNTLDIGSSTEGFLRTRNRDDGKKLSTALGSAYGAGVGFAIGGPVGAAVLSPLAGLAGGLLFEGGLAIRGLVTGEKFD